MPIEGRNLRAVGEEFRRHLNALLTTTISYRQLSPIYGADDLTLSFRDAGRPTSIPIGTNWGQWWLYVGQICNTVPAGRNQVRLQTTSYRYAVATSMDSEPIFRWEYVRFPSQPTNYWARHHFQGAIAIDVEGSRPIQFNDMHVPTGWVPIEEVIRFCIVDLGVPPIDDSLVEVSDGEMVPVWHQRLVESIRSFKTASTSLEDA